VSRPRRLACAAIPLLLLAAACRPAPEPITGRKIRIGFRPHLTLAPVFIALAEGLYAEQGLDVELVPIEGVASSVPLLLEGKLDVLPGPVSPGLFNAIHRGGRLRIVGDKGFYFGDDCAQTALVVSSALSRRGGRPTRVSMTRETVLHRFVERALATRGVRAGDVEQVYIPAAAEYDAIVSGRLDAANMGEPWLSRAVVAGAVKWAGVNELMAGHTYSVISYGPTLLDGDPEAGRRLAVAHLKAMRVYNRGKTERNLEIVAGALGYTPGMLRDSCWPRMREDGLIDTLSLMDSQRWLQARGELDAILPADRYWDPRFVGWAKQELERSR
jgi:NitT/TauT family transport system substrate-binding protein